MCSQFYSDWRASNSLISLSILNLDFKASTLRSFISPLRRRMQPARTSRQSSSVAKRRRQNKQNLREYAAAIAKSGCIVRAEFCHLKFNPASRSSELGASTSARLLAGHFFNEEASIRRRSAHTRRNESGFEFRKMQLARKQRRNGSDDQAASQSGSQTSAGA